jgi:hypothetical protein
MHAGDLRGSGEPAKASHSCAPLLEARTIVRLTIRLGKSGCSLRKRQTLKTFERELRFARRVEHGNSVWGCFVMNLGCPHLHHPRASGRGSDSFAMARARTLLLGQSNRARTQRDSRQCHFGSLCVRAMIKSGWEKTRQGEGTDASTEFWHLVFRTKYVRASWTIEREESETKGRRTVSTSNRSARVRLR